MLTARDVITHLGLEPLAIEGGYFRETYRAPLVVPASALPELFDGPRCLATAIYYLLTPESFSTLHRVASDEVFHFYAGDAVQMLQLLPDGGGRIVTIGNNLAAGHQPQMVVPAGVVQGCRLAPPTAASPEEPAGWALLGCTVAPGFEYADFVAADRARTSAEYPEFAELIAALTPP